MAVTLGGAAHVELIDYLRVLRRRWLPVLLAVLVCAGAAYGLAARDTPMYSTSTRLLVSAGPAEGVGDELGNRTLSVSRAAAYATYASTRPAVAAAVKRAGYPAGVSPQVRGSSDGETPFVTVTVSDSDPRRAAAVANAFSKTLLTVVADLDDAPQLKGQSLVVLEPAGIPGSPVSPRPNRNAAIGAGLGLLVGLGIAFVTESLDRTFVDPDVLEHEAGLSVLGVVPAELEKVDLPTITHPSSGRAEAYRNVRTNMQFTGPPGSLKRIIVTSATPGEGKTSVAVNVAVAMSRQGQSVVLVDADLRRPRVHAAFGLPDGTGGLAAYLLDDVPAADLLHPVDGGALMVLPAGRQVANPSELLGGARMTALLESLSQAFDVVLVDTPPVLPVTDALVLAVGATGVVVVVRLGETSRERVRRALASLRKLDVALLGLVANGAEATGDVAYGYGAKYGYSARSRR